MYKESQFYIIYDHLYLYHQCLIGAKHSILKGFQPSQIGGKQVGFRWPIHRITNVWTTPMTGLGPSMSWSSLELP
jgi:hypothetical protein